MSNVLQNIARDVALRLAERKLGVRDKVLEAQAIGSTVPHRFSQRLRTGSGPKVIAEIKFASPSQGLFEQVHHLDAVEVAQEYLRNGASALSVLTEVDHFGGSPTNLKSVRRAFPEACLLMKDFIFDPYQIFEARIWGADCVLLIVSLLGPTRLRELLALCNDLQMEALVEVHDQDELVQAQEAGARIIGVNNRNLSTLKVSLDVSRKLASLKTANTMFVSESGLESAHDLWTLSKIGYDAFLIGTSLMRNGKPGLALSELLKTEVVL